MGEISEIEDRESFEAWLKALPRATEAQEAEAHRWGVILAHRSAMRVLPDIWNWYVGQSAHKADLTALQFFLRCALINGVAGSRPTPLIRKAASSALSAADSADSAARSAARAAAGSAARAAAFWENLRADCAALVDGQDLNRLPLWSGANPVADAWASLRQDVLAQGAGWQFWVDWYDKALTGNPQDWDLLEKIALMPETDWGDEDKNTPADTVNARIARIIEQHELANQARRLKAENEALRRQLRELAKRSHNNPPALVDDASAKVRELTLVRTALDEAERELEKPSPSRAILLKTASTLTEAANAIASYCLSLGDAFLQSGVKAAGAAAGFSAAGYLASHSEHLLAFANAISQFARTLGG